MKKCDGCGVEKDESVLECYPWQGPDDCITDEPIPPLFQLDVQGGGPFGSPTSVWKTVDVCHGCFHKLAPDYWIDQKMWESLIPCVSFDQLPELVRGRSR